MRMEQYAPPSTVVALFTSAWIEIRKIYNITADICVALFTSAWIEIYAIRDGKLAPCGRTLYECVD